MVDYRKIKSLLVLNEISQSQLANMIGITRPSLSRKMNKKSDFTISELDQIATILKVKTKTLIY